MARWMIPITLLLALHAPSGCGTVRGHRSEPTPRPELPDPPPTSQPSRFPDGPGKEAIRKWALTCYQLGLKHNPVFSKGGSMVVQWRADQDGELLYFDFSADTFGSWEISASGETLAACISRSIKTEKIRWSASGTAPLRFSPTN